MNALAEFLDDVIEGLANIPVWLWFALGSLAAFIWAVLT